MAEPLAVDANCLLSALLGGRARNVVFSQQFVLYSPQTTLFEVAKHLPWLAAKLRRPEIDVSTNFNCFP